MKAVVYNSYGSPDVLQVREVDRPEPKENEVLIKVRATSINCADGYMLTGKPFLVRLMASGAFKPKVNILGADTSGVVEAVGSNVKKFKIGDEVFGDMAESNFGGLAEYACATEDTFVLKPANITFEQAAAVPMAGVTALKALRDKGKIKAGQKVLINGASGGVGSYAVQIAKAFGAEVTAVCSSRHIEKAKANGADYVIDYKKEDFTKGDKKYDLILAANGYHTLKEYKRVLAPQGIYVVSGGKMAQIFQAMIIGPFMSKKNGQTFVSVASAPSQADLSYLSTLLGEEKIVPFVDKQFSIEQTKEAFSYLVEGHASGKIIISIS